MELPSERRAWKDEDPQRDRREGQEASHRSLRSGLVARLLLCHIDLDKSKARNYKY